jgi:hypothetical protein
MEMETAHPQVHRIEENNQTSSSPNFFSSILEFNPGEHPLEQHSVAYCQCQMSLTVIVTFIH